MAIREICAVVLSVLFMLLIIFLRVESTWLYTDSPESSVQLYAFIIFLVSLYLQVFRIDVSSVILALWRGKPSKKRRKYAYLEREGAGGDRLSSVWRALGGETDMDGREHWTTTKEAARAKMASQTDDVIGAVADNISRAINQDVTVQAIRDVLDYKINHDTSIALVLDGQVAEVLDVFSEEQREVHRRDRCMTLTLGEIDFLVRSSQKDLLKDRDLYAGGISKYSLIRRAMAMLLPLVLPVSLAVTMATVYSRQYAPSFKRWGQSTGGRVSFSALGGEHHGVYGMTGFNYVYNASRTILDNINEESGRYYHYAESNLSSSRNGIVRAKITTPLIPRIGSYPGGDRLNKGSRRIYEVRAKQVDALCSDAVIIVKENYPWTNFTALNSTTPESAVYRLEGAEGWQNQTRNVSLIIQHGGNQFLINTVHTTSVCNIDVTYTFNGMNCTIATTELSRVDVNESLPSRWGKEDTVWANIIENAGGSLLAGVLEEDITSADLSKVSRFITGAIAGYHIRTSQPGEITQTIRFPEGDQLVFNGGWTSYDQNGTVFWMLIAVLVTSAVYSLLVLIIASSGYILENEGVRRIANDFINTVRRVYDRPCAVGEGVSHINMDHVEARDLTFGAANGQRDDHGMIHLMAGSKQDVRCVSKDGWYQSQLGMTINGVDSRNNEMISTLLHRTGRKANLNTTVEQP